MCLSTDATEQGEAQLVHATLGFYRKCRSIRCNLALTTTTPQLTNSWILTSWATRSLCMLLVLGSLPCYHSPLCGASAVFETGLDRLLEASLPLGATGLSRMARCSASRSPRNRRRKYGRPEVRCRRSDARDTHDNMTSSVHFS